MYSVSADGGFPHALTRAPSEDAFPSWSHDGNWIYFSSNRSGRFEIWKMPSEGGSAVQVTRHGGIYAFESADGKFLYYSRNDNDPGVFRIPVEGGEETQALDRSYVTLWALFDKGLCFISGNIQCKSFESARAIQIGTTLDRVMPFEGFAVSPDGRRILHVRPSGRREGDMILIEDFR